ncbi:hypothetical protein J2T10_002761 [Paenarthrobacter nicotinovorans]|jgi:hypothetical protein|uniref:Uncharacterized protein n=1 Tax=Paenarthrobacter nicotinovorans TaxID=29320 RepID=A0ABT9TN54_PAENI|nr:hypothetical protein [Paenarthrobacter nicotinovorans]MDQ0103104.1 hypothetical protein [Paenarthrobacter nicotinovorans]GAT88433.1 hypothetical protein CVCC1112_3092 [Paenarthrobacter nicotinovorans]
MRKTKHNQPRARQHPGNGLIAAQPFLGPLPHPRLVQKFLETLDASGAEIML